MFRRVDRSGRVLAAMAVLGLLFVLSAQIQPPVWNPERAGDTRSPTLAVVEHMPRGGLHAVLQRSANGLTPPLHPFAAWPEAEGLRAGVVVLLCLGIAAAAAARPHAAQASLWRRGERAPPPSLTTT